MKRLLSAALLLSVLISKGQLVEKDKTIAHLGQGSYIIELMQSPDSKRVGIYFQNRKYETLTDIQHIEFTDKDDFMAFIKDMQSVDADHLFHGSNYVISGTKGGFGGLYLSIYNSSMSGYFSLPARRIKVFQDAAEKLK